VDEEREALYLIIASLQLATATLQLLTEIKRPNKPPKRKKRKKR